ncbi:MAG: sulfate adenylyltransferase [Thermoanaerobaculia bacterium]
MSNTSRVLNWEAPSRTAEKSEEPSTSVAPPQAGVVETGLARHLIEPHGGVLVDRFVPEWEREGFVWAAARLPQIVLDARELADLELIATGAASPLKGFLGSADYESVLSRLRLASGVVWPIPVTLAISDSIRRLLVHQGEAALVDESFRLWGTVRIEEIYRLDARREAREVYGTEDVAHPGVADLLARSEWLLGGSVRVLPLPETLPFAGHRLTPRALRAEIARRGWKKVAGFQTRNPIHRAHEHLTKLALELTDGLVIHPLVGETKGDDVPAPVRFQVYESLIAGFYPRDRTVLAAFPAAMRYAGPREALFHALVRKNYGITHFIVGRDHAGVGSFYPPLAAQEIFDRFTAEELGVTPLRFDPAFYCRACGALASARTCPHSASARVELSGTKVRELLASGKSLPVEFTRPETAAILRSHYAKGLPETKPESGATAFPASAKEGHTASPASPASTPNSANASLRRQGSGFILWFTGLSGSGKSTLAQALALELGELLPISILDGDEVRTSLSADLGFSKADRDTNVKRIGFVARALARTGAVAISAAISPYRDSRLALRRIAEEEGLPFIEIHVHAEIPALVARDVKGLYKKALAGEIQHFTGISDPYEAPEFAEITVRSDRQTVSESLDVILDALREKGLVSVPRERVA